MCSVNMVGDTLEMPPYPSHTLKIDVLGEQYESLSNERSNDYVNSEPS